MPDPIRIATPPRIPEDAISATGVIEVPCPHFELPIQVLSTS